MFSCKVSTFTDISHQHLDLKLMVAFFRVHSNVVEGDGTESKEKVICSDGTGIAQPQKCPYWATAVITLLFPMVSTLSV